MQKCFAKPQNARLQGLVYGLCPLAAIPLITSPYPYFALEYFEMFVKYNFSENSQHPQV